MTTFAKYDSIAAIPAAVAHERPVLLLAIFLIGYFIGMLVTEL